MKELLEWVRPWQEKVDPEHIIDFLNACEKTGLEIHGIMIAVHDRVIFEAYSAPYNGQTPHIMHSFTKTLTNTAVGLAFADGLLQLDDPLLKYFPEEIEKHKGFIQGFEADLETLAAHPHPEDGFAGMEIRGDTLTDKENAGAALLDACKEVKGSEPVQIGSYRGFTMSVEFSAWKQEYTLLLKGQMTHRASLGTDPRGNLTRIDNALSQMSQRLEATKAQLDNLYQQQAAAKEEVGKPFPYEDDLRVKSARLVELDTLLNLDGRGRSQPESVIAKSARPSVLDSLKRPMPPRSPEKKPKQHEEVR